MQGLFSGARVVLEQDVALSEKGKNSNADLITLTLDDLPDVVHERAVPAGKPTQIRFRHSSSIS